MAGVFELFHLSLLEVRQLGLFEDGPRPTREEWLRQVFNSRFEFQHRSVICHWVPDHTDPTFIAGNVVRSHPRRHHVSPEEGAFEVVSEEWQGAIVLIDPVDHPDGQKVSFERDSTLGEPRAVLQSLIASINATPTAPYVIEPKPIFNEARFWSWAAAHEYRLKRISFELIAPNMFGSKSALDEDMKYLGESGVSKVKITMDEGTRPEGIDAQNDQIKQGVDYAAQGGGSITAKAKNGDSFASTNNTKTTTLPATPADRSGGIKAITKWFPKLLGREQDDSLDDDTGDPDGPVGN